MQLTRRFAESHSGVEELPEPDDLQKQYFILVCSLVCLGFGQVGLFEKKTPKEAFYTNIGAYHPLCPVASVSV